MLKQSCWEEKKTNKAPPNKRPPQKKFTPSQTKYPFLGGRLCLPNNVPPFQGKRYRKHRKEKNTAPNPKGVNFVT